MKKIKTFVIFTVITHILLCVYNAWHVPHDTVNIGKNKNYISINSTSDKEEGWFKSRIKQAGCTFFNWCTNGSLSNANALQAQLAQKNAQLKAAQSESIGAYVQRVYKLLFNPIQFFKALSVVVGIILLPMGVKFLLFILASYLFKNVTNIFQTQDINDSKAISISNNSRKKISVLLDMGESMLVKSDRVHGYSEKSGIKKCKSIFFNFNNPIISIFSGLTEMDMYTNKSEKSVCFDIKPLTPYEYFTELKFENCKGAFIVPKSIVGISPTLQLNTKWCIKNFLYTGRLRYYFVTGTGKILLSADGGVLKLQDMQNYRITEKSNIIFMDLSLNTQAIRTDICYNYVMRNAELFDVSVSGNGIVLIRNNSGDNNFGQKMMSTDSFLNVIGHLLGF